MFYPTAEGYIFSSVHGIFSRIDYMLGQRKSQQIKKTEIIPCIISEHNRISRKLTSTNCRKYTEYFRIYKYECIYIKMNIYKIYRNIHSWAVGNRISQKWGWKEIGRVSICTIYQNWVMKTYKI